MHVMIDLETLGISAGCPVLSIGAVVFNENGLEPITFYGVAHSSQLQLGLKAEQATLDFWNKQDAAAKKVFGHPDAVDIVELLDKFAAWLDHDACIWGNGAGFDQPILGHAYKAAGKEIPWKFFNERCYRTIKALAPDIKLVRHGTYHNALDDAISQANHMVTIVKKLKLKIG